MSSRDKVISEVAELVSLMGKRRSNSPTRSSLKAKINRTIDRRSEKQRRTGLEEDLAA